MFGMKWERILEDRTFFSKAIQSPMVAWHCKDLWPLLKVSLVILLYGRNYCYIPDFLFYKCFWSQYIFPKSTVNNECITKIHNLPDFEAQ